MAAPISTLPACFIPCCVDPEWCVAPNDKYIKIKVVLLWRPNGKSKHFYVVLLYVRAITASTSIP